MILTDTDILNVWKSSGIDYSSLTDEDVLKVSRVIETVVLRVKLGKEMVQLRHTCLNFLKTNAKTKGIYECSEE